MAAFMATAFSEWLFINFVPPTLFGQVGTFYLLFALPQVAVTALNFIYSARMWMIGNAVYAGVIMIFLIIMLAESALELLNYLPGLTSTTFIGTEIGIWIILFIVIMLVLVEFAILFWSLSVGLDINPVLAKGKADTLEAWRKRFKRDWRQMRLWHVFITLFIVVIVAVLLYLMTEATIVITFLPPAGYTWLNGAALIWLVPLPVQYLEALFSVEFHAEPWLVGWLVYAIVCTALTGWSFVIVCINMSLVATSGNTDFVAGLIFQIVLEAILIGLQVASVVQLIMMTDLYSESFCCPCTSDVAEQAEQDARRDADAAAASQSDGDAPASGESDDREI